MSEWEHAKKDPRGVYNAWKNLSEFVREEGLTDSFNEWKTKKYKERRKEEIDRNEQ